MNPNIRIILTQTSHPGNIGASARAMKTMGLENLYLVKPKQFPHGNATAMAAGAEDILESARIVETIEQAIEGCELVLGTSVRQRSLDWPLIDARAAAGLIQKEPENHKVAILFGRENHGLFNEELQLCHYHVRIPVNPNYGSLNLAAAVQIIAYEIRMSLETSSLDTVLEEKSKQATVTEMEGFYQHLERALLLIRFITPEQPNKILPRLRRLYNRARPNKVEVNILRGILTEVERLRVKND